MSLPLVGGLLLLVCGEDGTVVSAPVISGCHYLRVHYDLCCMGRRPLLQWNDFHFLSSVFSADRWALNLGAEGLSVFCRETVPSLMTSTLQTWEASGLC